VWRFVGSAIFLFSLLCALPAQTEEIRFVPWQETQGFLERLIKNFETQNSDLKIVRVVGPHSSTEFHDLVGQMFKYTDPDDALN
jgi:hypothetical protein